MQDLDLRWADQAEEIEQSRGSVTRRQRCSVCERLACESGPILGADSLDRPTLNTTG